MYRDLIFSLKDIAVAAGIDIMDVYSGDMEVEHKDDDSPLTIADKRAHQIIAAGLEKLDADIPVLSEEGNIASYEERKNWKKFWLVDPLDGTKEFIKKNGEFTVNIALIEDSFPVLGIIYAPALDTLYIGAGEKGAVKIAQASNRGFASFDEMWSMGEIISALSPEGPAEVVASRSHMNEETEAFINELKETHDPVNVVSAGSSLKFCLVAEGQAHFYPRYAPTMEWDTAAGQAVVEAAGGSVLDDSKNRFAYNKENLKNGWFLVKAE